MKKLCYLFILSSIMIKCNAQEKKYSKINFDLCVVDPDHGGTLSPGPSLIKNYSQEYKGALQILGYPKNIKKWDKLYATRVDIGTKSISDSLCKLYRENKITDHFEIFATFIDKKYFSSSTEFNSDTQESYTLLYIRQDTEVDYTYYQLTKKGWLEIEKGRKKYADVGNEFIPYMTKEAIESIPIEYRMEEK